MGFDKGQVFDYIATADSWIDINDALGSISIRELTEPLIASVNDDGGVSYILNTQERYRSSTLATVLNALADVQLLPLEAVHQMQDHLYALKSRFVPLTDNDDIISKAVEDSHAWGIDEAPSVWTTSMALIALLNTKYTTRDDVKKNIVLDLRESVYWLANQAYNDGGWGYQKYTESLACGPLVSMTALAMKAIILAQQDSRIFNADAKHSYKFNTITRALTKGKEYLLANCKLIEKDNICYWSSYDKPGISVTMWATEALEMMSKENLGGYKTEEYYQLKERVCNYIYSQLPDEDSIKTYSQSELFFQARQEDGLKYKKNLKADKKFYTFKPYIISRLLDMGEDPFNPKIVSMIGWLLNNREQHWTIEEYNSSSPCSISAAMAINVIVKWLKKISKRTFSKEVEALLSQEEHKSGYGSEEKHEASSKKRMSAKVTAAMWGLSCVIAYFVIDYILKIPFVESFFGNFFGGEQWVKVIFLGAAGSLLATGISSAKNRVLDKVKRGGSK